MDEAPHRFKEEPTCVLEVPPPSTWSAAMRRTLGHDVFPTGLDVQRVPGKGETDIDAGWLALAGEFTEESMGGSTNQPAWP